MLAHLGPRRDGVLSLQRGVLQMSSITLAAGIGFMAVRLGPAAPLAVSLATMSLCGISSLIFARIGAAARRGETS